MQSSTDDTRTELDMHWYQDMATEFILANPFCALFIDVGLGKTIVSLTAIVKLIEEFIGQFYYQEMRILIIAPIRVANQTWPNEVPVWEHTQKLLGDQLTVIRAEDDDDDVKEAGRRAAREMLESSTLVKRVKPWQHTSQFDSLEFGIHMLAGMLEFNSIVRNRKTTTKLVSRARSKAMTEAKERIRQEKLARKTAVHLIDKEHVEWLVDQFSVWTKKGKRQVRKVVNWPYQIVFIDESSYFKDHSTNRFNALAAVRHAGFIERLIQLTATPMSESLMGIFAQMYLLDLGRRLGSRITHFRQMYFSHNPYAHTYTALPGAEEKVAEIISDITLVMEASTYLPRDRGVELIRPLRLEPSQLESYKKFERDFIYDLPDGGIIEAITAADLSGKLIQLSSGALYDSAGNTHVLHNIVLDDLEDLYDELNGSPLLVFYWFKSSLARLKKRFPKIGTMDKAGKNVGPWNDGKYRIMAAHPASMGHGLNMQLGPGHDLYYFDAIISNELWKQGNGRVDRQGQKNRVRIHEPRVIDTAHEDVYGKVYRKEDSEQRLKKRITRIREEKPCL